MDALGRHSLEIRNRSCMNFVAKFAFNVLFDPRTRVYRAGAEATIADLKVGDRVYLDTLLDGDTVFARSIRLKTTQAIGESQGVVTKYRADHGELTIRDSISPEAVRVR